MSVSTKSSADGAELTISIDGRFDFAAQKEFRHSYEKSSANNITIDMTKTEYMDSSALGMLLMLREHAGGSAANIVLKNCSQDIRTILSVANFQSLFKVA